MLLFSPDLSNFEKRPKKAGEKGKKALKARKCPVLLVFCPLHWV
jgi:hypothetical protein